MKLDIQYINDALLDATNRKLSSSQLKTPIDSMAFMAGDCLSHPDFPGRWLIVKCRHFDLTQSLLTLFVDLLPPGNEPPLSGAPSNVVPLFRDASAHDDEIS